MESLLKFLDGNESLWVFRGSRDLLIAFFVKFVDLGRFSMLVVGYCVSGLLGDCGIFLRSNRWLSIFIEGANIWFPHFNLLFHFI